MNWLFVHRDFPGQYLHVVRRLAEAGERIVGIGQRHGLLVPGLERIEYAPAPAAAHLHLGEFAEAVENGLAVARLCRRLDGEGFVPDIVIGHNGWGETLFVKDVWPRIPLLNYFEFFYRAVGSDVDFDPEFPPDPDLALNLRTRNAINLVGLDAADWGQTPTRWQRDQYPQRYHDRLSVVHEGVETVVVRPDRSARLRLRGGTWFGCDHEIVTYSARNLEPYRGFHVFMRALPRLLRLRPRANVLVVGGDGVSYGPGPARGGSWRQQLIDEVGAELDLSRVHFLGRLGFRQYLSVLQLSRVHVYLTYPFVLSWSLIEALSAGCLVVASRTPPVEEVVKDGENGYLVDFFDGDGLANRIGEILYEADAHDHVRAAARTAAVAGYDLDAVALPAYLALIERLTGRTVPALPRAA
jgi:glycosyltransferase involved in cell wall biosynthesis